MKVIDHLEVERGPLFRVDDLRELVARQKLSEPLVGASDHRAQIERLNHAHERRAIAHADKVVNLLPAGKVGFRHLELAFEEASRGSRAGVAFELATKLSHALLELRASRL